MGHGDNIPDNIQEPSINILNTTGDIILTVMLICVILIVTVIAFIIYYKDKRTITRLKEFNQCSISEEERNLLIAYRRLNDNDQNILKSTLNALSGNHKNDTTE